MAQELTAVILAAGRGVRMRSALPKVLHRLCGLTLVERVVRAGATLSPREIVVVIGFGADQVRKELGGLSLFSANAATTLTTVEQKEQRGTGHAVQVAIEKLSLPDDSLVLIMPGDIPLLGEAELLRLRSEFAESGAALGFLSFETSTPHGFGRVLRLPTGEVSGIIEEKDCTDDQRLIREVNSGVYLVRARFLREATAGLTANNAQGELYLTDIVSVARERNVGVVAVNCGETTALLGANSRAELSALEALRREAINRRLMDDGVTFEDPRTTYVDEDVIIGADTFLGANSRLQGHTTVGAEVVIEGDCLIRNAHIEKGVTLKLGCYIDSAVVGEGSSVGPYAQLRPDTVLGREVKIGNFVEVKKSTLADGAKANHLTYLGDATIGEHTNIGAGTITCNYDGVHKSKTVLGKKVFIGSNSSLVAPVTVGDGAYVGAGSVITKDVPSRALGIARGRQTNIERWAEGKASKK